MKPLIVSLAHAGTDILVADSGGVKEAGARGEESLRPRHATSETEREVERGTVVKRLWYCSASETMAVADEDSICPMISSGAQEITLASCPLSFPGIILHNCTLQQHDATLPQAHYIGREPFFFGAFCRPTILPYAFPKYTQWLSCKPPRIALTVRAKKSCVGKAHI